MPTQNESEDERRPLLANTGQLNRRKSAQFERKLSKTLITPDGESDDGTPVEQHPEGGWGWVVVFASFLCNLVLDGISYSFGMFLTPLVTDLHASSVSVATVGSLQAATYLLLGPVVASLVTKYGSRPVSIAGAVVASLGIVGSSFSSGLPGLIAGYSLVAGVGFGLLYIPAVVTVAQYFTKRRGLATSICVCGTGVGTFILPPLMSVILDSYGWRWAFRVLSALCLACVLCSLTMIPISSNRSSDERQDVIEDVIEEEDQSDVPEGWFNYIFSWIVGPALAVSPSLTTFFLVMAGDFLATICLYIPYTYLPPLAISRGLDAGQIGFLISSAGISNTVGRLSAGWLCDQNWLHPITITLMATTSSTIPLLLMTWSGCDTFPEFLIFSALFGLLTGFWLACESPLIMTLLGVDQLASAFGLLTCGGGVAALIGPPLAGYVIDLNVGKPWVALQLAAGAMALSALAYVFALALHKVKERKNIYRRLSVHPFENESQPKATTWIKDRRQSAVSICLVGSTLLNE